MKKLLLLAMMIGLLINGCATTSRGFGTIGQYNEGQFALDRNEGFIKLYTPESENYIPDFKLRMYPNCINWIKRCEWHCLDFEGY